MTSESSVEAVRLLLLIPTRHSAQVETIEKRISKIRRLLDGDDLRNVSLIRSQEAEKTPECKDHDIMDYLISPMQRITRYPLLLKVR